MMNSKVKKLALAMSLALGGVGMVPSAQAVSVSADNLGQALIFPYYTVRGGWLSLFGVVNTSNQVVAVKVRFHEAYNSRDVFDFNIILSPYDEWTGWLADSPNGPVMYTEDKSCTVGDIFSTGSAGVTFPAPVAYTGSASDGGPTTVDRMREGYVEMIMMGASPGSPAAVYPLASGAIHASGARPTGCAALVSAFQSVSALGATASCTTVGSTGTAAISGFSNTLRGEFCNYAAINTNLATSTVALNPLKGTFSLVNGGEGFNAVGLPTALQNFRNSTAMTLQLAPTNLTATTSAGSVVAFADSWHEPSMNSAGSAGVQLAPSGTALNPVLTGAALGAGAVSDALMHTNVINEWSNRTNAAAGWVTATDWVITFPTKGMYVDNDYSNQYAGRNQGRANSPTPPASAFTAPFAAFFVNSSASPATAKNGQSCDPMSFTLRNREEQSSQGAGFSPGGTAQLCYETNVLTFNQGLILNSPMAASINYPEAFTFGWLNVATGGTVGLPTVGFAITSRDDSAGLLSEAGLVDHSYVPPTALNAPPLPYPPTANP